MQIEIGTIEAIFRYPVKSMRGESLEDVDMDWHGIAGDRRLSFRRLDVQGGFPWLTAGKVPELVQYTPQRHGDVLKDALPTHVLTPDGEAMPIFGEALATSINDRFGVPVQMMHMKHGIFDEGSISVIATDTVDEICRLAGKADDVRRFRPNILVRLKEGFPFAEDQWVGGELTFGVAEDAASIAVTQRDIRCAMLNIDPDHGGLDPLVQKAAIRANENNAGIYATVTRSGRLSVGQPIYFRR